MMNDKPTDSNSAPDTPEGNIPESIGSEWGYVQMDMPVAKTVILPSAQVPAQRPNPPAQTPTAPPSPTPKTSDQ